MLYTGQQIYQKLLTFVLPEDTNSCDTSKTSIAENILGCTAGSFLLFKSLGYDGMLANLQTNIGAAFLMFFFFFF